MRAGPARSAELAAKVAVGQKLRATAGLWRQTPSRRIGTAPPTEESLIPPGLDSSREQQLQALRGAAPVLTKGWDSTT